MRTTLTLDDDVAALLAQTVKRRGGTFKDLVNDALRLGLEALAKPSRKRAAYTVRPWNLGGSLVGSLDNIEEVLSRAEGEDHR